MNVRRFPLLILGLSLTATNARPDWKWHAEFTPTSSPDLAALHEEIHTPRLEGVLGVPVVNLHWREECLDFHFISGTVFLEPPIRGSAIGAFFVGRARVTFDPGESKTRQDLKFFFGRERLENLEVPYAYFWTLRGQTLLEQIEAQGQASVPLDAQGFYAHSKFGLRTLGTRLLHSFLNRDGRSRGTAHVLFAWEDLRPAADKYAPLLYSFDPNQDHEVALSASGTKGAVWEGIETIVQRRSNPNRFVPHAKVGIYKTDLSAGKGMYDTREDTEITFTPHEGVSALTLEFTSRLAVSAVTGMEGTPLPFLQWTYLKNYPNYDEYLLIDTGPLEPGQSQRIRILSSGSLFEPWYNHHWLAEEDTWHPLLDDPAGALYDLRFRIPKGGVAVGAGLLESETVEGNEKVYHFRTSKPHKRSTLYYGDFTIESGRAEDTKIEIYVDRANIDAQKNVEFVLQETGNMLKLYNRLYPRLEVPVLRLAGTPTRHGRGFEGLILLAQGGGFGGSSWSDLFRAHEVAHMWWGNMVQPENWPEDRWLSESFAEYSALEYYRLRFEKPERTKELIWEGWHQRMVEDPKDTYKMLTGEKAVLKPRETFPLLDGGENVYYKGPAVLHMLRYLFQAVKNDEEGFWNLLRDFLEKHKYQAVGTEDFTALAEQHLGIDLDWFWDQWLYRGEIPLVKWSHTVTPGEKGWVVTVEAEQADTAFNLAIPIYVHFKEDRQVIRPLFLKGAKGTRQLLVPEEPVSVTLNDFYEALVKLDP